jgi:hypothetical protein
LFPIIPRQYPAVIDDDTVPPPKDDKLFIGTDRHGSHTGQFRETSAKAETARFVEGSRLLLIVQRNFESF